MHVARSQRTPLRARDRLLAEALHVERDLALAVRPEQAGVEAAHRHHVAQSLAELIGVEVGGPGPDRTAVVVEDAHQLFAHQRDALHLLVEVGLAHLAGGADVRHRIGRSVPAGGLGDPQLQGGPDGVVHGPNLITSSALVKRLLGRSKRIAHDGLDIEPAADDLREQ